MLSQGRGKLCGVEAAPSRAARREGQKMTARVVESTQESLWRRREELLKRARVDYEDLKERAEHDELVGDEWRVWDELKALDYLLGAESPSPNGNGHRP